jgi:uncharacterized protein
LEAKEGRTFIGRFDAKADLLDSLTSLCKQENIRLGTFSVIGALENVKLGYYKQDEKKYVKCLDITKKLEIASCIGNISLLDGEIFVHAHITVADHQGQTVAGHLMADSRIFAAEYHIQELTGIELKRKFDQETGLNLW